MMQESPKQLNAFEIKREIARLVKALENSTILVDTSEFRTLDAQEDKSGVVKILMKEFLLCNDDTMPVIKLLLLRYAEIEELLAELESIIKNPTGMMRITIHTLNTMKNWFNRKQKSFWKIQRIIPKFSWIFLIFSVLFRRKTS